MSIPELRSWQTESLRVTFIANELINAVGKDWWQTATGVAPESITSKPNAAEHSESGPFADGRLEMKVTFNRVDWMYTPIMVPGELIPHLGEAQKNFDILLNAIEKWLDCDDSKYTRIAYGPAFLHPVADETEANEIILSYLPFARFEPKGARDVLIQTNFPIFSIEQPAVKLNRMSKFMYVIGQTINFANGQALPIIKSNFYCRVELDFSTDAERLDPFPAERRSRLIKELIDSAKIMMLEGVK